MFVAIMICVWGTRKQIPYLPVPIQSPPPFSPMNLVREVISVFKIRSFLAIFFGLFMGTLVLSIEGVFGAYMAVHFWGFETDQIRFLVLGAAVGLPISFVLTPKFTKWFDKRNAIIIAAAIAIINANIPVVLRLLDVSWFPTNGSLPLMMVLISAGFLGGAIGPIIFTTINSIFADICDEFELDTGQRIEGVIYSARAFALKATGGIGTMIGGIVLDLIEFPTNAVPGQVDPDVIWRLGVAQGPATSVFTLLSLLLYFQYKLDRKRHAEIAAELALRHAAAAEAALPADASS
jgi:Na+/melibiose symporter-like transporter